MALIQTVHLSMANFKSAPVVPAVQNDTDRQIKMVIDDFDLTAGLTGKITFVRSDGTHYESDATLDTATNSFTADIDQALTQPGRTMVQLKVTDTLTVSTFSFVIFVEEDTSGTVTPQEGISLTEAVEEAENAAERAEAAAAMFDEDVEGYVNDWLDAHPEATTTVQDHSLTYEKLVNGTLEFVTPEMYGAVGNGIAKDGAAIQAALNSGKIVVGTRIYNIDTDEPYSDHFFINIPDGSHLVGGTYKFPDNGYVSAASLGRNMFCGNSFIAEDCIFDMNGTANIPVPTKRMLTIYSENCNEIVIKRCRFKDTAGRNYIYIVKGSNFRLENCTFHNGGTTQYGSDVTKQNDFSYVFAGAENSIISKCVIEKPDYDPFTYCGGFELHGDNSIAESNEINNCLPALYISAHSNDENATVNVQAIDNTILNCQGAISLFNNHSYDSIVIKGNYITLSPVTPVQSGMYGIASGNGNVLNNITIKENTIIQKDVSTYGSTGLSLGNVNGLNILQNIIKNIVKPIYIVGSNASSDIAIEHNRILSDTANVNYVVTRQDASTAIKKLTILENEVQNYAGLLDSLSSLSDYVVLDRLASMDFYIVPSKNVCPVGEKSATVQGVPTEYKNGRLKVKGTGTSNGGRLVAVSPGFSLSAGTYTWKVEHTSSLNMQIFIESGSDIISQGATGGQSQTFTLSDETSLYFGINIVNETEYDDDITIMLESGSTPTVFVPSGAYTVVPA